LTRSSSAAAERRKKSGTVLSPKQAERKDTHASRPASARQEEENAGRRNNVASSSPFSASKATAKEDERRREKLQRVVEAKVAETEEKSEPQSSPSPSPSPARRREEKSEEARPEKGGGGGGGGGEEEEEEKVKNGRDAPAPPAVMTVGAKAPAIAFTGRHHGTEAQARSTARASPGSHTKPSQHRLSSGTGNRFKSLGARELATPSKVLHYGDEAGKSDANRFAESDAHEGQPASRPDGSRGENASSPSAASSALDSALIQSVAAATQSSEELLQNIQLNRMKKRLAAASAALDAVLATDDSTGENEVAPVLLREDVERPVKQGWVKSSSSKSFDKTPSIIDADKSTIRSSGSVSSLRESSKLSPSTRRPSSRLSASFSDNNIRSSAKSSRDALRTSPSTATKENRPNLSRKVAGNFNGEGRPLSMHASRNSHAAPPPPAAKAAPVKITGDVLIRRKKKATVPKPFNFSSRRNKFGTPKHIRAQREAKARRAAREANRLQSGTRRTKYF